MKAQVFILLTAFMVCGCSLDEKVISSSTSSTYYRTVQECMTGLNGCYDAVRSIYGSVNYFLITDAQTDLAYINNSTLPNGILKVTPVSPQYGSTMWTKGYQGVMRCNAAFAAIERSPIKVVEKAPLLAEAVVLRALYYYILTSNFGDVPYYEEEVTAANNRRISRLGRMSSHATRDSLIKALHYWILEAEALDFARTYDVSNSQQYRAGAALGLMLGGKMCLWEERWTEAIEFFSRLEDIYGNLSQYRLSDIPFSVKFSPESIFEISNIAIDYGLTAVGDLATRCTPTRSASTAEGDESEDEDDADVSNLEGGDYYGGVGIPKMGTNARTKSPIRPTQRLYKTLMPYSSNDRRRAQYSSTGEYIEDSGGYMAWGWVGYDKGEDRSVAEEKFHFFWSGSSSSKPYLGNKFWCWGMQYTNDGNNYKAFRYAGALLGLSEAWLNSGNLEKACEYLNMVKMRAGLTSVTVSDFETEADLLVEIQNECGRELFGEYQRKHDLVRWGIWYDYVMKYNVSASSSGGMNNTLMAKYIQPCHEYYPIPDPEITYSGGTLDNKEYKRYGL